MTHPRVVNLPRDVDVDESMRSMATQRTLACLTDEDVPLPEVDINLMKDYEMLVKKVG